MTYRLDTVFLPKNGHLCLFLKGAQRRANAGHRRNERASRPLYPVGFSDVLGPSWVWTVNRKPTEARQATELEKPQRGGLRETRPTGPPSPPSGFILQPDISSPKCPACHQYTQLLYCGAFKRHIVSVVASANMHHVEVHPGMTLCPFCPLIRTVASFRH